MIINHFPLIHIKSNNLYINTIQHLPTTKHTHPVIHKKMHKFAHVKLITYLCNDKNILYICLLK